VCLVAGEQRFGHVRHPVATDLPFGRVGLLVVCAMRFGLSRRCRARRLRRRPGAGRGGAAQGVAGRGGHAGRLPPGAASRDVLAAARSAYAEVGEPDAWEDHHQGGPAGYLPRDWLATPDEGRVLRDGMALAWNPSLPWAKSEDTFLLADDGLRNLTWDERWPHELVDGRPRAAVRSL
jgi:Xaa-Pro dipeptidase